MLLVIGAGLLGAALLVAWLHHRRPVDRIDVGSVSEAWVNDHTDRSGKEWD